MGQEERLVELGALLRERRDELGLRRSDVARRAGLTHAYIRTIEDAVPRASGHRSRPSEAVLRRWTSGLGMSAGDRARILQLVGYVDPSDWPGGTPLRVSESGIAYQSDQVPEHELVTALRVLLDLAQERADVAAVEEVLRPIFALLQARFSEAAP